MPDLFDCNNVISGFLKKHHKAVSVISLILTAVSLCLFPLNRYWIFLLVIGIILLGCLLFNGFKIVYKRFSIFEYMFSLLVCVSGLLIYHLVLKYDIGRNHSASLRVGMGVILIPIFLCVCFILGFLNLFLFDSRDAKKHLGRSIFASVLLAFIVLMYVPFSTYTGNIGDFDFTYWYLLRPFGTLFLFVSVLGVFFLVLLREKINKVVCSLLNGLSLCVTAQYMFMDNHLNQIGVDDVFIDKTASYSIINLIVWIVLLFLPLALSILISKTKKDSNKILAAVLLAFHVVSYVMMLISAGNIYVYYVDGYMDMSDQYTVSKNKNVVMFVFDAADNSFIYDIMRDSPESFDGLEDFTVYTNTCSMFKSTDSSFAQMFGGSYFDSEATCEEFYGQGWNSYETNLFYNELHDANFTVNAYNMEGGGIDYYQGKFDNAVVLDEEERNTYKASSYYPLYLMNNFGRLLMYQLFPYVLKDLANPSEITFNNVVIYDNQEVNYTDQEFMGKLDLSLANDDSNYLIIQHLKGPHSPCDDYVGETKYCLDIVKEYINQMKALGVYDDATIIIASDHGKHSYTDNAATPIFMIKEAGVTLEDTVFTSAPEYHKDIMATLAACTGIAPRDEESVYGTPVFMWSAGMMRERTFYRSAIDENYPLVVSVGHQAHTSSENVYHVYTFTGNTDTLRYMVETGIITEIYPMVEYYG